MSIKQRIRSIRAEQGISQEALAELLDVSRQTISKWENGQVRPSAENLARLSHALGVSVDALVKDDWIPPEPEVQIVEVPVSRSRNYRLWALLAAAVLVAGILVGALFFRKRPEVFVHSTELEGEVIDNSMIGGGITLLPP
ncbi:MAG: helix-turn-helix transcriptional regulator [Lawsonibacter sp.]|nr:helix-turn-helix transcriptional regulator [Lawsonibacter sp.]